MEALLVSSWLNSQLISQPASLCQTLNYPCYTGLVSTEETRWLTAEEQRAWRAFLTACQTLFSTIDAQLARDAKIPHGYYEILVRLSETPGRALRMTQLAEASTSSKSRLSHGWRSGAGSSAPTAPRTAAARSRSSPTTASPRSPPRRPGMSRRSGGP